MSRPSRMSAGILLIVLPSVMYGGLSLLTLIEGNAPGYLDNPVRQNLWRAGHAHADAACPAAAVLSPGIGLVRAGRRTSA